MARTPKEPAPAPAAPKRKRVNINAKSKRGNGTPKGQATKPGGRGGRIGNPAFVPTDEHRIIVRTHAACGTPHWLIAEQVGITEPTLRKYFNKELETGLLQINARMASTIARQGLSGCRSSQRLWMTTRGGWKTQTSLEHTGPDGAPIPIAGIPARNPSLATLTKDELRAYLALQRKLEGANGAGGDDSSDG